MAHSVFAWWLISALSVAEPDPAQTNPRSPQTLPGRQAQPPGRQPTTRPATTGSTTAPAISSEPRPLDPVDPGWLERLKEEDRAPLEELRGYAPPAMAANLTWLPERQGAAPQPLTWNDLRGRVVVVQAFTTANMAGRKWPERVAMALKGFPSKDLRVIALHTPENGERAADFLAKQPPPPGVIVAIDAKGNTSDSLGIFRAPVNIVIDRQGVVRFVGLNERGLVQAVNQLAQEKFDASKPAPVRAAAPIVAGEKTDFPPVTGRVQKADDLRGKPAPEFFADEWLTPQPEMRGRVVVVNFWATTCTECVEALPHVTELADEFGDRAAFIGLSDEKQVKFEEGLRKIDRKPEGFHYALALDPQGTMSRGFGITALPHCAVISSDWIVRWQGLPGQLTDRVLGQIIKADASAGDKATPAKPTRARKRWVGE